MAEDRDDCAQKVTASVACGIAVYVIRVLPACFSRELYLGLWQNKALLTIEIASVRSHGAPCSPSSVDDGPRPSGRQLEIQRRDGEPRGTGRTQTSRCRRIGRKQRPRGGKTPRKSGRPTTVMCAARVSPGSMAASGRSRPYRVWEARATKDASDVLLGFAAVILNLVCQAGFTRAYVVSYK